MPELDASELAELVDPEAIAQIINENRSLTGSQLDDANAAVGHVVLNLLAHGESAGDGRVTAPIGLPDDLSDYERDVVLEQARRGATRAIDERIQGIDPTGGAVEYNHRALNPTLTSKRVREALGRPRLPTGTPVKLTFGPFSNSYPTPELPKRHPVYLSVYGN